MLSFLCTECNVSKCVCTEKYMKSNHCHNNKENPISNTEIVCPSQAVGTKSFLKKCKSESIRFQI